MTVRKIIIAAIALGCLSVIKCVAQAQESPAPPPVEIEKKDQTILRGRILRVEQDTAIFQGLDNKTVLIPMRDIRSINKLDSSSKRSRWPMPANRGRYFITSNAYPLRKGEILLSNTYLLIHSAHVGITDKFTLGGGGELIGRSLLYVSAKLNLLRSERHSFSTGLHVYTLPPDFIETFSGEDVRLTGLVSATSTWGNHNHNFSVGAGYLIIKNGSVPPIVNVSGTTRIARNFSLLTENWFFFVGERTGFPVVVSLGGRYLGKRFTFDLGFYSDHKALFDAYVPYFAFSLKLGRK